MKLRQPHIAFLSFALALLAGCIIYYLPSAQLNDDVQTLIYETGVRGLSHDLGQPDGNDIGNTVFSEGESRTHQQFYQRFSLNWDQFKVDNGTARVPTASASQSLQINISSLSPDELSLLSPQHLIGNKPSTRFSRIWLLLTRPFFKKLSLLPMVSCTAIGAP